MPNGHGHLSAGRHLSPPNLCILTIQKEECLEAIARLVRAIIASTQNQHAFAIWTTHQAAGVPQSSLRFLGTINKLRLPDGQGLEVHGTNMDVILHAPGSPSSNHQYLVSQSTCCMAAGTQHLLLQFLELLIVDQYRTRLCAGKFGLVEEIASLQALLSNIMIIVEPRACVRRFEKCIPEVNILAHFTVQPACPCSYVQLNQRLTQHFVA
mmetsp:Transcript_29441/g.68267  ORF Transcript_29441/g.68267 Transcript_29441/m.68267 type:complete len:210 (-) Transcript_29441:371-1000(-)